MIPFFDLSRIAKEESAQLHESLEKVITSGQFIGGDSVKTFEEAYAAYSEAPFCVSVGNGLDAIRIMFESFDLKPGDEVIVPAFTYYATWLAAAQAGLILVPVDVSILSASIDTNLVEEAITQKTKAILVVSLFGISADFKHLSEIASKHNIFLFHDAAQCHGLVTEIGKVGSFADATAFSFYPTKNLGALGDAGAIVTSSEKAKDKMISRRSYGQGKDKYVHIDTGWNSRMDPLQAEFLKLHLTKLDDWNLKRSVIAKKYLESAPFLRQVVLGSNSNTNVWHHFVIRSKYRSDLQKFMKQNGINTDVHYPYFILDISAISSQISPIRSNMSFPIAEELSKTVTSMPIGPWMNEIEIQAVADVLSDLSPELI